MRRFDGVAGVFAIAVAGLTHEQARRREHGHGVIAVGAFLRAADVELGCPVDGCWLPRVAQRQRSRRNLRAPVAGRCAKLGLRAPLPLRPEIGVKPFFAALAPEAAFAVAAEAGRGIEEIAAVNPDAAGFDLARGFQRQADVLAPDGGSQPVARIVRQLDRLARGAEAHRHQDGTRRFLAGRRPPMLPDCSAALAG